MVKNIAFVLHTLFWPALLTISLQAYSDPRITLGDLPLLFVDDGAIANSEGIVRHFHEGVSRPEPVVVPDKPWEGNRVYIYGAVLFDPDQNQYRMWYLGRPTPEGSGNPKGPVPELRNAGFDLVLHATSPDGLHWEKPSLGQFSFEGNRDNNIVFDLHSPTIIRDPFASDPAFRYKMLGALSNYPVPGERGYYAAYSEDGFHWFSYPQNPVLKYSDTITLAQNPRTGEFLAFHKRPASVRGFPRRIVWLSRSMDFQDWSPPEIVLVPDEFDDAWNIDSDDRMEIYNMSVFPHAGGFIGFPTMFRVMKERDRGTISPGQSPVDGPIDVQLATSPDGSLWTRAWPRQTILPRGRPGSYNAGAILGVATAPINTATKSRLYYTAITTGHGGPLPEKRISIGLAEWRLHGFASLDAGPDGGWLRTETLSSDHPYLILNADASLGEIRVALIGPDDQPYDGYRVEDCLPLKAIDSTQLQVSWLDRSTLPDDKDIRVEIQMVNARLYSISSAARPISQDSPQPQNPE